MRTTEMDLADILRRCVLNDDSISSVARSTGVPQATLQEFAIGKSDGDYADIRLSSAQLLIDHYEIPITIHSQPTNGGKRMKLKEKLLASKCYDSPEKFRERLIENLMTQFPGTTIDNLVCNPMNSLDYCDRIREGVASELLENEFILKSLMNIRKRKNCPTGLKSRGKRQLLKSKLLNAGCDIDALRFKEMIVDCLAGMYRDLTIDDLVCMPRGAGALCNYVRMKAKCDGLSDELILSALMNVRKAS
jgi:hypothetical protein